MARRFFGATTIDVVTATACLALLIAVTAAVVGPAHRVAVHRDALRTDGVRNIMEAMLEMQTVDPERIDALRDGAEASGAPPRVMIGTGETCAGDWGAQCSDAILADDCLDFTEFAGAYLSTAPVDPDETYTAAATGYYIDFSPGVLEVGACSPETLPQIHLERTFF